MNLKGTKNPGLPLYEQVFQSLLNAIEDNKLLPGHVLKVAVTARHFAISREPVQRALEKLMDAGYVDSGTAQGYVVVDRTSNSVPEASYRKIVTFEMLSSMSGPMDRSSTSSKVFERVESDLISQATTGRFKLISAKMSDYYGVSRTIGNELVGMLSTRGIVESASAGKPILTKFTEKTIKDNNELRLAVECFALKQAIPNIPNEVIVRQIEQHRDAEGQITQLSSTELSNLEVGIHETLLSFCGNERLIEMLKHCGMAHRFNSIYFEQFGPKGNFVPEHLEILAAIQVQNIPLAILLLEQHIVKSIDSTMVRLKDFRARTDLERLPFLVPDPG